MDNMNPPPAPTGYRYVWMDLGYGGRWYLGAIVDRRTLAVTVGRLTVKVAG